MVEYVKEGMSKYLGKDNYEKKRYTRIANFFKGVKGFFLDVGCCQGGLRKYITNDLIYFGIDGIENKFKNYVLFDFNQKSLPFKDKTFDAINCSAVLEHLFYPLHIMEELSRILKDDGVILISLPNDKGLNSIFSHIFGRMKPYEEVIYEHHWQFSIHTARLFVLKKFKIIKEEPEFGPLFEKYLFFLKPFKIFCTEWMMFCKKI